ncbi:hypothetical protein Ancab_025046 [Ancistrocladus abbreviatus]
MELSLSYARASPNIMAIPKLPTASAANASKHESELSKSVPFVFDKIEFPNPKVVNENQIMVFKYFGIPYASIHTKSNKNLVSSYVENHLSPEASLFVLESFSTNSVESVPLQKHESPTHSVSTNRSPSSSVPISFQSSDTIVDPKSYNQGLVSSLKKKKVDVGDGEEPNSWIQCL